jgi:hypothetical protein
MLLNYSKGFINYDEYQRVEYRSLNVYYRGIIWMRGKKAGRESIEYLIEKYVETGKIPYIELFGAFSCIVEHSDGRAILFTDNSNMHCFFVGDIAIGTNFLEVAKENDADSFDLDALCEFISLGGVYFGKTLLKGINLTNNNKAYIYDNGELIIIEKEIGGIDAPTSITDANKFFSEMAYALSEYKVTLSLTGGYDSRMVFACLNNYIPISTFISGDNDTDSDIVVSQRVTSAAGKEQELIRMPKPEISEDYIRYLFEYAQGVVPFLNDGYMRVSNFIQERADKGYNCYLTGDGGPRHKDWYWVQDFPFYRKKQTNVTRFYNQRIEDIKNYIPWGRILRGKYSQMQNRIVHTLSKFVKETNTQSYDSFGFEVLGDSTVKLPYSTFSEHIPSYAPLWELELVRYSYRLPRRKRFFNNSMRDITTKANPAISKIPTGYGTTASSELPYILRDVFFQLIDYFKKASRLLGRKVLKRSLFVGKVTTWTTEQEVRKLNLSSKALDYCIRQGYISEGKNTSDISYSFLGRIIQIYMLGDYLSIDNTMS